MKIAKTLCLYFLSACFLMGSTINVSADASKLREQAKANLNSGKIKAGLTALIELSDNGDIESSYILGVIFSKSKIPQVQRSVTLAEKYLLRAAKNCHEGSLKAISAYVYKKRGSKLFDPAKAQRLESTCSKKSQIADAGSKSSPKTRQSPIRPSAPQTTASETTLPQQAATRKITADVRKAWASQRPTSVSFGAGASGVAISTDGVFLTNHHVVDGCAHLAVEYQNMIGRAHLLFADKDIDLAAIKVAAPTPFYSTFDSSDLRLGEPLVALGYPVNFLFGSEPSVSEGRLTNTDAGKSYLKGSGFLLVSIPLASGNSGGPVYNNRGLLRGVVSYGIAADSIIEDLKEKGADVAIESVTFNFIVSGLSIMERLQRKGIDFYKQHNSSKRLDVEDLAAQGKMSLANVKCG